MAKYCGRQKEMETCPKICKDIEEKADGDTWENRHEESNMAEKIISTKEVEEAAEVGGSDGKMQSFPSCGRHIMRKGMTLHLKSCQGTAEGAEVRPPKK